MTTVAITQNDDIERAIDGALQHIDLASVVRGKVVAVKPNDTWASADDTTGVTQPDTLRAVLRAVKRHVPRELVVSGGAGAAETDEVFQVAGLMDVVVQEGATFADHNRPPFAEVALDYAPEHDVAGRQLAAMAKRFPIQVAITVGHPAMIATGPLGGHAVETGVVITSTDPVAADVIGAKLLGFGPQAVRHLWEAARLGLGETDVERMEFPELDMRGAIQAFTEKAYGTRLTFEHA